MPTFLIGVWIGRRSLRRQIVCSARRYALLLLSLCAAYAVCGVLRRRTGVLVMESIQLSAFALLFACVVGGVCAWIDARKGWIMRPGKWAIALLALCGSFSLELYAVQEFYWYYAGPLEGKLTYLQTNLLCMVLFPITAWLLSRFNCAVFRAAAPKAERQGK